MARLSGGRIRVFSRESGLPDASVFSLLETTRGELLAGTETGLARFRAERWEPVLAPGLPAKALTALLEETLADGSTVLWIGTYGAGLSRLANGVVTTWDVTSGLPDNRVEALLLTRAADGTPTLWIGTDAGPVRFVDGKPGAALQGLPNPLVRSLLVTTLANGRRMLWVGTVAGAAMLDPDVELPGGVPFSRRPITFDVSLLSLLRESQTGTRRSSWASTRAPPRGPPSTTRSTRRCRPAGTSSGPGGATASAW